MAMLLILNSLLSMLYSQQIQALPKSCDDLLPDVFQYISFFEQVGDLRAVKEPKRAEKIYDVLAIRRLYQETTRDYLNPIDDKIKNCACKCRKNNADTPTSDSQFVRTCIDKNIEKLIKESKTEYKTLRARMKKEDNLLRLTNAQQEKIENLKDRAYIKMGRELIRDSEKKRISAN